MSLHLLGGFRLMAAGAELRLPTRKAEALLAYLALPPGHAHRRDKLAALLWGDRGEQQARHSLSQTLFSIRKTLADAGESEAPPPLATEGKAVAFDPARVEVDADAFERLAAEGTPAALAEAAALYRGDLLEGLRFPEEPAFEEWLVGERGWLRELALATLARLLEHEMSAGATERAVRTAVRLLAIDPLQEGAHRTLMRLYAEQGRRGSALKQYEVCARVLERELGIEPEAATRELHREILRQRAARDQSPAAAEPLRPTAAPPASEATASPMTPPKPQRKILVVEDAELNRDLIVQLLEDDYAVVTAADGAEGLALAAGERPDLILMDLSLPVLDGWEATRRLKADGALRHIPVVALTAHALPGDEARARASGCDDYLTKPIDEDLLFEKLRRFLENDRTTREPAEARGP